jgi:hypothetical protein
MSRGKAMRRRRDEGQAGSAGPFGLAVATEGQDWIEQDDRLEAKNARLRDELSEVEGWYRLLQAEHATLKGRTAESGRRFTMLQAEANRLAARNQELQALVSRFDPGAVRRADARETAVQEQGQRESEGQGEKSAMRRIYDWVRSAPRHKWGTAAFVTIATLLARDPGVQGVFGSAVSRARQAVGGNRFSGEDRATAESGFLRYAAMIQSHDHLERARRDYNENEPRLKGDALLEAQDRLRAAKQRARQAKLAFLPELVRQCDQARMPVPPEAAEALAALNSETAD